MNDIPQRITRLAPLAEVFARIDAVTPVPARDAEIGAALGRILAEDVAAPAAVPAVAISLRDGWAVRSELTLDASSYAPASLVALRVDAGDPMPSDCDAVLPLDAIENAQVLAPAVPGEGVLAAGADAAAAQPLRRNGQKLRTSDLAIFAALGIPGVRIREPRVWLVRAAANAMPSAALIGAQLAAEGAEVFSDDDLEAALQDETADAVIGIGGTGSGRQDDAVRLLARDGAVAWHGIGLMPGETSALGSARGRPVLLLPGRIDAALAAWLVLGKRLLARLSGRNDDEAPLTATLLRKVTSTIGIADFVPVRRNGNAVEPLASGDLPLAVLTRADGWILVPPDSEGYPAGASVSVRPLA
jgi:molybdopterin biosynthesis enzyme